MAGLDGVLAGVTKWMGDNILIDTVRITAPSTEDPILNTTTGQMAYSEGELVYEGLGAVVPRSTAADVNVVSDVVQPWARETKASALLLTPLEAPIPPQYAIVTVTAVHDPTRAALIGRTWVTAEPGLASTVEVIRRTPIDQRYVPASGGTP